MEIYCNYILVSTGNTPPPNPVNVEILESLTLRMLTGDSKKIESFIKCTFVCY